MATVISWPLMLGLTIVVFTILFFLQRTFYRRLPRNFQIVDVLPPILIWNIHIISVQTLDNSFAPYLIIIWLTLLIAYVIYRGYLMQNFKFWPVLIFYWRITALVLPIVYIIFVVLAFLRWIIRINLINLDNFKVFTVKVRTFFFVTIL